jgi:hypothetical protein
MKSTPLVSTKLYQNELKRCQYEAQFRHPELKIRQYEAKLRHPELVSGSRP